MKKLIFLILVLVSNLVSAQKDTILLVRVDSAYGVANKALAAELLTEVDTNNINHMSQWMLFYFVCKVKISTFAADYIEAWKDIDALEAYAKKHDITFMEYVYELRIQIEDPINAEKDYLKLLKCASNYNGVVANFALFYIQHGEIQKFKNLIDTAHFKFTGTLSYYYARMYRAYLDKNYTKAFQYCDSLQNISYESRPQLYALYLKAQIQTDLGDSKGASQTLFQLVHLDSIIGNLQDAKKMAGEQIKEAKKYHEFTVKQLEREKQIQRIELVAAIIVVLILIVLVIVWVKRFKDKKIAHEKELSAKAIIEAQKHEIVQSIEYAKHLQEAILPDTNRIKEVTNGFVYYQPKDIVAGDFYWFKELDENKFMIAAADCTGHGVPGAMTSMVCSNKLTDAYRVNHTVGNVLSSTNKYVKNTFKEGTNDGMDIALCMYDKSTKVLNYAGANRPLVIIRNFEVIEYKATKSAIGHSSSVDKFENNTVQLQEGDWVFMYTDGYVDQFGGTNDKKLGSKGFKDILKTLTSKDGIDHVKVLNAEFNYWKGEHNEQIDDVLVIGFKA